MEIKKENEHDLWSLMATIKLLGIDCPALSACGTHLIPARIPDSILVALKTWCNLRGVPLETAVRHALWDYLCRKEKGNASPSTLG